MQSPVVGLASSAFGQGDIIQPYDLVVEGRMRVGGAAVHADAIPSKTLRATVLNLSGRRERDFYGRAYLMKKCSPPD